MNDRPIDYIKQKGWQFKQKGREFILQTCPFCSDAKYHFYINCESGVWFCHKCQGKGNLWQLKKQQGDIKGNIRPAFSKPVHKEPKPNQADGYHQALMNNQDVRDYLSGRGISSESVKQFNLGVYKKKWLTLPHYQNKKLVNIKFRSIPPEKKTFRRLPDCKSILFNVDVLNSANEEVYICEGEFDAITLVQHGITNAISNTIGAGSFDAEWIDQLKKIKKIFLCYDNDEAGQKGARALAKRLGYNRCWNVVLPKENDINDYFHDHCIGDFKKLCSQAQQFDLQGIISIDNAISLYHEEKRNSKDNTGIMTPWENINALIKGFKAGDLIIVAAPPKTGKTTWCLNIALYNVLKGLPVLFYCLEMRPERLAAKVVGAYNRKSEDELTDLDYQSTAMQVSQSRLPLYFGHSFKKPKIEDVLGLIREAVMRYDLKLVVFDNLHWLIRSVTNVNEELGQAVQGFKLLAEEMEIPVITIAQPRKLDCERVMTANDIKYSNAIHSDCDQMLLMHRTRKASESSAINPEQFSAATEALDPITLIRAEAHRFGAGGEALLYYHGEYSTFDKMDENFNYVPWQVCMQQEPEHFMIDGDCEIIE